MQRAPLLSPRLDAAALAAQKKRQSHWEVAAVGKTFVALVTLESLGLLGSALVALALSENNAQPRETRYMSVLALYVTIGFFYFAIDSILLENVFQFWVSIVIHTIITMFVAWFHFEEELGSFVNDFTVYVLGVVVVLEFVYLGLSPFVQKAFGWRLYKRIGTKAAMQEMYRTASFFFSLLKLDLFLGILLVCLASFFLFSKTSQIVLNAVAMALTVAWALSGWSAVYNETRSCIFLFYAFALLQPAYICYKLYELHFHANDYPDVTLPQFAISGSLSLIVRALLLVWAHFAHLNFGKGLREKAFFKNDVDESTLAEVREYARPLCPCAEDTAVAEEAKSAGQLQPRV